MYGNNGAGDHFNRNQHHYWPRGHSPYNNPRYSSQSSYTQRDGEQYRRDYKPYQNQSAVYEHDGNPTTMLPSHMIPSVHYDSFYQKGNNTIYNNIQTGNFKVNTLQQNVNQGYPSVSNFQPVNYEMSPIMNQSKTQLHDHQGHLFQPGNFACSKVETTLPRAHTHFQPSNVSLYTNQVAASKAVSQDDADKIWLKQWLEQRQLQSTDAEKVKKTLKISEAQNLFQRYLNLNNQLKEDRDVLQKNVESEPQKWNHFLAKAEKTKEEIKSIESILNDQEIIQNLQEKIHTRKQKRLWLKRRRRRRYLEKQEDEDKRKLLHEKIDVWQNEIKKKDLAARKAASLKHEAGGVLGEVRRKLQDCRKLQELMKSLARLRELRKSEGEKKGVYPKTSSSEDVNFKTRCEYVEKMVEERRKTYDEEEKALRVIIMEEEGEREKKEKQERLEQKAMLNLSKEADPLAEFTRYYGQADESFQYLIQIRREWDIYLTPDVNLGSRIPNEDITAGPPTSSLWASVLEDDAVGEMNLP